MNYYIFVVTLICVATSRMICVLSVNSPNSENLWKTSTVSMIQEMLEKFNSLNIFQTVCSELKYDSQELYCQEFVKENNDYFTLKHVLETKINEVQGILVKLLALERKAIVCRSMRYLLTINIYGAFVSYASGGSTGKADVSEKYIFDDMFRTELHRGNKKIEETRQLVKDENDTIPIGRNALNGTEDRKRETPDETHVRGFVEKIKYIVQAIRPFLTDDFRDFDEMKKTIDSITVDAGRSGHSLFPSTFRALNGVYATECAPNVDATAFLGADAVEKIVRKDYSAPKLVGEIDWLFGKVQRDIGMLYVRCFYINHKEQFVPDVSMMYFHAFNKYYDPKIWRLIGDEIVVDKSNASAAVRTSLNDVAARTERQIDRISKDLSLSVYNGMRCRSVVYVNVMMKLRYYVVRVLIENVREVQRLAVTLCGQQKRIGEFVDRVSENGAHRVAATMTLHEFNDVFEEIHDVMAELGIDGHASDDDDISDTISSTIDELNRNATVEKEFKSVFFVYSMFDWYLINESVEDYQLKTNYFDTGFVSMLRDLKQTTIDVESKSVEQILKWYKWGLQTYKDNCNSGIRTNISHEVQLTLTSIISKMDALYSDLDIDIDNMSKLFHL